MALVSRFLMYKLHPPHIMNGELFPSACEAWVWVQGDGRRRVFNDLLLNLGSTVQP